jgi:hypothetical protein
MKENTHFILQTKIIWSFYNILNPYQEEVNALENKQINTTL